MLFYKTRGLSIKNPSFSVDKLWFSINNHGFLVDKHGFWPIIMFFDVVSILLTIRLSIDHQGFSTENPSLSVDQPMTMLNGR